MKQIYLDYAATTPVDKKVLRAMLPYFTEKFGNPMSLHSFGEIGRQAIKKSRQQIADFLHCNPEEVVFTSGATESNNLAVKGIIKKCRFGYKNDKYIKCNEGKPHIITTSFEHHCVLNSIKFLEKSGQAEVTYLPVYKDGIVKIEDIKKAVKKNTVLISIMYVNNEIGTIQPIEKIGKIVKNIRSKTKGPYPIFHTDATQAINYLDCDVKKLGVDMLSLSGHKIYGPKGTGVLYLKEGTPVAKIQDGGDQENKKRAGTHNVPGIVGLGMAVSMIKNQKSKSNKMRILRDFLIKRILKEIKDAKLNGSEIKRSPNNVNVTFKNVEGESLILMLDQKGIACSTGSACSSGSLEPSHVLMSIGIKPEESHGSIRITIGKYTTRKELEYTVNVLKETVNKLRSISGDILKEFN